MPNENYTLTFSKPNYTFNPNSITISNLNSDLNVASSATLAPTAATTTVSGRVVTDTLFNARVVVTLTAPDGTTVFARPNLRGYFSFANVESGRMYILSAQSNRCQFASQVVTVNENLNGLVVEPLL